MVISVPQDITEVERKAVEDAAFSAGQKVYLVKSHGRCYCARLPITEAW